MKIQKFAQSIVLSLMTIAFNPLVHAQKTVSDSYYLRKLSYSLRGGKPSVAEFAALETAKLQNRQAEFFQKKIEEYLRSTEHADRMAYRLTEHFRIRPPSSGQALLMNKADVDAMYADNTNDALTDLFRRLVRDNLPWDYLLTGHEYNLFQKLNPTSSDLDFLSPILPQTSIDKANSMQSSMDGKWSNQSVAVRFAPNDPRIAGAITTSRFINRYNGTNVNKNRKRAAAVFRIFMCDDLSPVIPSPEGAEKKSSLLPSAFDDLDHTAVTEQQLVDAMTVSDEQRHGSDKLCAACHYKLDPMGLTFRNLGVVMNPDPAPGRLTLTQTSGKLFDEPVSGLGELGAKITQQPDYLGCQVQWFWNEFIGRDVPLSPPRKQALTEAFNKVNRKTVDFVRLLVTAPEFRQVPNKNEEITFEQVVPLLNRCDSCHIPQGAASSFVFEKLDLKTMNEIRRRLLLPASDKDKMPMNWTSWDPKDLELILKWIDQVAK